jgi:hypothetical protein
VTKSLFQHATAQVAQLDRPIADEGMRRLVESSDVLLMEVNDDGFPALLGRLLHTSTKVTVAERTALERTTAALTAVLQLKPDEAARSRRLAAGARAGRSRRVEHAALPDPSAHEICAGV